MVRKHYLRVDHNCSSKDRQADFVFDKLSTFLIQFAYAWNLSINSHSYTAEALRNFYRRRENKLRKVFGKTYRREFWEWTQNKR
jgi:hypothetical protein